MYGGRGEGRGGGVASRESVRKEGSEREVGGDGYIQEQQTAVDLQGTQNVMR